MADDKVEGREHVASISLGMKEIPVSGALQGTAGILNCTPQQVSSWAWSQIGQATSSVSAMSIPSTSFESSQALYGTLGQACFHH